MRDSRNEGAPIFGDADPNTSSGIAGLYTKAEADAIVSDNSERGYGAPHYHAKSLAVAHEFAQGLAGNLIRRVQRQIGVMGESKKLLIKKSSLRRIIRERLDGHEGPNPPSAFPIRVGWDGGSYDAVDDEDLEMITRDLVAKGIAYSVDLSLIHI